LLLDIKTALEIVDKISKWMTQIVHESRASQEKEDAQLLGEAAKLLASLRALDNSIHSLVGKLTVFDLDWAPDRRNQLITDINDFAHREDIVTVIRQSLRELQALMPKAKEEDWKLAVEVFGCGADLLRALSDSPVTPFPNTDALREFAMRIKKAESSNDVQRVVEKSELVLNVLDRRRLAAADQVFGRLKGQILARYPGLPRPDWRV